jgi:hypothetical protein
MGLSQCEAAIKRPAEYDLSVLLSPETPNNLETLRPPAYVIFMGSSAARADFIARTGKLKDIR